MSGTTTSADEQLEQWLLGNPLHNVARDECTPDFSCCRGKEYMVDEAARQAFYDAYKSGNDDLVHGFLMMFLSEALVNKGAYIAGFQPAD